MCVITKQDWLKAADAWDAPGGLVDSVWDELIVRKRWPDGIRCPYCNGAKIYFLNWPFYYRCAACKKKFSNTTGTIFLNNKIDHVHFITWAFEYLSDPNVSPMWFKSDWCVTYVTAWKNLQKIKRHMKPDGLHFMK